PLVPPQAASPPQAAPPPAAPVAAKPEAAADNSNVVRFSRQARRWRRIATVTSALAASLVALVGVQIYNPDLLPQGIRPKAPPQRVVQVPAPAAPAPAQYVAVLQKDGSSPAFILSVDAATRNFTVRKRSEERRVGKECRSGLWSWW